MQKEDRILITGGTGLIGKNLTSQLLSNNYDVLSVGSEVDLRDQIQCKNLFEDYKPSIVFHLAAKVGGIFANSNYKSAFYSDNVLINTNVVNASSHINVRYIFAMGTGCAYPKRLENQILKEEEYLDGIPEITNDAYAYAKRGLLVHLKAISESSNLKYTFCLPANIYGPHDNFHPKNSHVVPGLIRRFCDAEKNNLDSVDIWGDSRAKRDFLYIDDCIDAMILLAEGEFNGVFNVATSNLVEIKYLAETICKYSEFKGQVNFDTNNLSGQMQRSFDDSKMKEIGWTPKIKFEDGIQKTINWFRENRESIREV